ncbi:MAG: ABC transporter ATP-binding protein [Clostridium sp.]
MDCSKTSQELILQIQNLNYSYEDNKPALSDVNLKIFKGEKIAVLGSNGAGKSTFFLNMNGVLTPDRGDIIYRGKKILRSDLNELRKNVGIVFQDADNQMIASTVRAEVSFGPMNLKLSKEEVRKRVDETLTYMNLENFRDRPPHYLSGGEKKRVSIADIIAMKPEIMIFDEPTASLDPFNTQILEGVLERLSDEGKTLLISTHDMDFAYRWAERVVVFSNGRILADGTPLSAFQDDTVIEKAGLKRPTMLDVYEMLTEHNLIKTHSMNPNHAYPKNIDHLRTLLQSI